MWNKRSIKTYCLILGMFSLPAGAQLASPVDTDEAVEPLRRYTVEMIIFEYADRSLDGNEVFVPDAPEPIFDEDDGDSELVFTDRPETQQNFPGEAKITLDEIPPIGPIDVSPMSPGDYTMRDIYAKLERLDAYRPIMHVGWTQTTDEKNLTPPIRLRRLGNAPLRLDGNLTLYLSRYLHLVVDLTLDGDQLPSSFAGNPESGFRSDNVVSDKPDPRPARVRYRINEDRIFKSGDLRYFEHPRFGVLVKVTRYEPRGPERNPASQMLSGAENQ
jgi:hypothetical protein